MMRTRSGALALLAFLPLACSPAPSPTQAYQSPELGFALTLPPGWRMLGDEATSRRGTLVNWQVKSLEGAQAQWLEALPESVVPELQRWTEHYFGSYQDERREPGTLGGERALILSHTVTVGRQSTPSVVRYWIARHGQILYLVRAVYPAGRDAEEDPGVRALLASWRFTAPATPLPG